MLLSSSMDFLDSPRSDTKLQIIKVCIGGKEIKGNAEKGICPAAHLSVP
jgi:hypothetical protein